MKMSRWQGWLLASMVFWTIGCGGSGEAYRGPRGTVTGRITVEGKPLVAGCSLLLQSEQGQVATAVVHTDGKYSVIASGGSAIPVGKYKVQLSAPSPAGGAAPAKAMDPAALASQVAIVGKPAADAQTAVSGTNSGPFPSKYASIQSSGLEVEVKVGANVADFDLKP